jgi:hypothetical protein
VQPKDTGDFAIAVKLDEAFKLPLSKSDSPPISKEKKPPSPDPRKSAVVPMHRINLVPAWHTET